MVDLADITNVYRTHVDGIDYLAGVIESGDHLGPKTRHLIAGLLRKEIKLSRGEKRNQKQAEMEGKIVSEIMCIQHLWDVTEYKAKKMYLGHNLNLNEDTLKTYLDKAKKYEASKGTQSFKPKRMSIWANACGQFLRAMNDKGCLSGEIYNAECSYILAMKGDEESE